MSAVDGLLPANSLRWESLSAGPSRLSRFLCKTLVALENIISAQEQGGSDLQTLGKLQLLSTAPTRTYLSLAQPAQGPCRVTPNAPAAPWGSQPLSFPVLSGQMLHIPHQDPGTSVCA